MSGLAFRAFLLAAAVETTGVAAASVPTATFLQVDAGDSTAHVEHRSVVKMLTTTKTVQDPAAATPKATPAAPTWGIHHSSVEHQKKPGKGYSFGSPLYGQNMHSVATKEYVTAFPPQPPSTAMQCVIVLTFQFFLILTAVAVLKTHKELTGGKVSTALVCFQVARSTLTFVPMLCVFFLAIRMRSVQLAGGDNEHFSLPPEWMKTMMQVATYSVVVQALSVLASPVLLGKIPEVDEDGNLVVGQNLVKTAASTVVSCVRGVCFVGLWTAIVSLQIGMWFMKPPVEIWGPRADMSNPDFPWPATSVKATMDMTSLFFSVFFLLAVCRDCFNNCHKTIGILQTCSHTVSLAPMFCVLFIGARMRALQMDPIDGQVQNWAKVAMLLTTSAMLVQILAMLACGLCLKGEVLRGNCEGDVRFKVASVPLMVLMQIIRWTTITCIYTGSIMVLVSVCTLEHPKGPSFTPKISSAMKCVMILTVLYLVIYFGLFLMTALRQCLGSAFGGSVIRAFDTARGTVFFAPMMCVLFLGCRLRALQLTKTLGQPQGFAQDWMFLTTWATLLQVLLCFVLGLFAPAMGLEGAGEADEDGNMIIQTKPGIFRWITEGFRYFCMFATYGGAIGICYAIYTMTPTNANGSGSLFPWGPIPQPFDPAEALASAGKKLTVGPAAAGSAAAPGSAAPAAAATFF